MLNRCWTHVAVLIVTLCATMSASAELHLNRYFADHMVLQRDKPITVTGFDKAGATVTVSFAGQSKTAAAGDDGAWAVTLDALAGSATGKTLSVKSSTGKTIARSDVVVGDVYLFARQTSIDVSLGKDAQGEKAAAAYKPDSKFRAISMKTIAAKKPRTDLDEKATTGWTQVDRNGAMKMSAAAFYLGQRLAKSSDVPIGIVDLNMGHYFAIGWLSDKALTDSATLHPDDQEIDWLGQWMRDEADKWDSGATQKELDEYYEARVAKSGKDRAGAKPSLGLPPMDWPMFPGAGYNAVIHPLRHVGLKAVLLQLGNDYPYIPYRRLAEQGKAEQWVELDRAWEQTYKIMKHGFRVTPATLPYVPADWRRTFGDKALLIGLILPPGSDLIAYAKHNREIRELHRRTCEAEDGLGLILPGTEGVPFSGQPADEQLLASRCGDWVLGEVLKKEDVSATGPIFDRVEARLADATIHFKPGTADGLKATGDALNRFEASGPGGDFHPATARIDGNTIKLSCPEAQQIEFVRYNFHASPAQGLVNAAGQPALPFNNDDRWTFGWLTYNDETELPEEYHTTANKWDASNVALINFSAMQPAAGDSQPIPNRPGPLGFTGRPFGPNIHVLATEPGGPAHGKLKHGDLIFSTNGKEFSGDEDAVYRQLAHAISHSETEQAGGKLVLGVRRGSKIIDVELQLEVMGDYSATTPYYCPKTEKIIEKAKQWSIDRFRPGSGTAVNQDGMLNTDLWFLLATGDPEVQGLVRRSIYAMIQNIEPNQKPDPMRQVSNWHLGYNAMLLGEYYHATGDANVLPYLKNLVDQAAASQLKKVPHDVPYETAQFEEVEGGWRHKSPTEPDRWKSGYGLLPHAGMACVMGMIYADEAGVDIDKAALKRGLHHFHFQRAEHAFVLYSYRNLRRDAPPKLDPEAEANGALWSMNGKLGNAAALFSLINDHKTVEINSRYCVYGYNKTRSGHGGMFFNNLWTPIGAYAAGDAGFKHFMKGQTWWRELFRRHDGAFDQAGRGGIGVAYGIPYVAPLKRLRMLGAPPSAFGPNAPAYLKPALAAHKARDYAKAEQLLAELLDETAIPAEDKPSVDHLLESVRILRKSVEHDLAYTQKMIELGHYDYAMAELPQLKGVVAADDPRLKAIVAKLESPQVADSLRKLARERRAKAEANRPMVDQPRKENWVCLTPQKAGQSAGKLGSVDKQNPAIWRMKLVESRVQAPEGWPAPGFDDSGWNPTPLPISWAPYHAALFRTKVNIPDKQRYDALRFSGMLFQQANVVVYINGKLVAKVDNIDRGLGTVTMPLTDFALETLHEGENTIAFSTRHKRRWGPLRGQYTGVSNNGIEFMIDARVKD